jgi:hypothetical protein
MKNYKENCNNEINELNKQLEQFKKLNIKKEDVISK